MLFTCVAHLCRWVSACPSNDSFGALTPLVRRSDPSARPEACQPFSPSAPPRQPTPPGGGGPCSAQTRCSTRLLSSARARSRTRTRKQRRARADPLARTRARAPQPGHRRRRLGRQPPRRKVPTSPPPLAPLFPRESPPPPSPLPPSRPRALLCPGFRSRRLPSSRAPRRLVRSLRTHRHTAAARVRRRRLARARASRVRRVLSIGGSVVVHRPPEVRIPQWLRACLRVSACPHRHASSAEKRGSTGADLTRKPGGARALSRGVGMPR